jgi:hypothetical protein
MLLKNYLLFVQKNGCVGLIVCLLSGCAVMISESPEPRDRQWDRQLSISQNIQQQFSENKTYINIDFGDEYIIKPPSFKPLDSLYAVKYEESTYGGMSRARQIEIGNQIDELLPKVMPDTTLIKYEINHVFALEQNDSVTVISATFLLNAKDSVEKVSIDFQFSDHKKYLPYFVEFLKRQSFLYDQYDATKEESDFYDFFETQLNNQPGAVRKGEFIAQILHVMTAANTQKSLSTELIVKQLIVNFVTQYVASYEAIAWSEVSSQLNEENQVMGYMVQHEWKYTDKNGKEYHLLRQFDLDAYFQLVSVSEIDAVEK